MLSPPILTRRQMHRIPLCRLVFLITLIWSTGLALLSTSAQAQNMLPLQPPLPAKCIPSSTFEFDLSASPDIGGLEPTVLVTVGTVVNLQGIAEVDRIFGKCQESVQDVPFTWDLTFQSLAGSLTNAESQLQNATTLIPSFTASQAGTYTAFLNARRENREIQIEVRNNWTSLGPDGSLSSEGNGYTATGRVNALAFDPGNPFILYAGTALGGVWKTFDDGNHWFPITDHKGLPTLAVGALAVAPDGITIYDGTGDLNPGTNNFQKGQGIWKSTDGGVTWQPAGIAVGTNCPQGSVAFTGQATRILIDPNIPTLVYVSANEGLFRSVNGGNCWERLLGSDTGITDIAMDPTNPAILYVAAPNVAEGIFKTTNAEDTAPVFVSVTSLPTTTTYNRILLAVAPSGPSTIYAALSVDAHTDFLKSTDGGLHWTQEQSRCTSQCTYDTALAVSPTDPNRTFYGEVNVSESIDGMQHWNLLGGLDCLAPGAVHCDFHALEFVPSDPTVLYAANDGGVYRIDLSSSSGWEARNQGLAIAQAPVLALAPTNPQAAAIGVWDNGTLRWISGRSWQRIWGGDGFIAAFDAASDQTIYYNYNAGKTSQINRYPDSALLGSAAGYISNPYRPGELFAVAPNGTSGSFLYVSEQTNTVAQAHWRCVDPDPSNISGGFATEFSPDGSYYFTKRDGSLYHFTLPASPADIAQCAPGKTGAQNISSIPLPTGQSNANPTIGIDPFNSSVLYVVLPSATGANRVLRLIQKEGTWISQPLADTLDLPDNVTLTGAIAADPLNDHRGVLYVGTSNGLYVFSPGPITKIKSGSLTDTPQQGSYTWSISTDVPDTEITEIVAQRNGTSGYSGVLMLTTFGRGVWERIFSSQGCVAVGGSTSCWPDLSGVHCLSCPSGVAERDFSLHQDPYAVDGQAWFAVPYNYRGEGGVHALLRVVPLSGGTELPYFLTHTRQVNVGDGIAVVSLIYAASNAPLGVHTDALRYELLTGTGSVISSATVSFNRWWLRPDAHLLTVNGDGIVIQGRTSDEVGDASSFAIPVPLVVQVGQSPAMKGTAPFAVPVADGAKVTIQTYDEFKANRQTLYFSQWQENTGLAGIETTITLSITQDTSITAAYTDTRPSQPPGSGLPGWLKLLLLFLLIIVLFVLMFVFYQRRRRLYRMRI